MTTLSSIFGTDVEEIEPMAIPETLGDYGLDTNPSPYGTLQLKEYPFYDSGDAPEPGLGEAARTAGGRVGFNIRQNPYPFDMYPEGVNYMDSGLDSLNTMFPTLDSLPYDPLMDKIRAQQKKNATAGSYFTGQNLGTGGALATGYVDGVKTLLSAMSPEQKQKVYDTSYEYGGGDFTGGPLSAPDDYDSGYSYDTGYEYQAPVQEYASSSYRPSVNVDYYGL